jgi:hypothetical protein
MLERTNALAYLSSFSVIYNFFGISLPRFRFPHFLFRSYSTLQLPQQTLLEDKVQDRLRAVLRPVVDVIKKFTDVIYEY